VQEGNSVIDDDVVAPDSFVIVETDLSVPIIKKDLVRARRGWGANGWVTGEEMQGKGFLQGDCQLVIGELGLLAMRHGTKVSVSAGLGSGSVPYVFVGRQWQMKNSCGVECFENIQVCCIEFMSVDLLKFVVSGREIWEMKAYSRSTSLSARR
jgi:hypothetical protein